MEQKYLLHFCETLAFFLRQVYNQGVHENKRGEIHENTRI